MAVNIFEKFGIKEVANVYFEALADDIKGGVYAGDIVLFLDTLKVSTIETSAESTDARGGWGNPRLITWDYGKEITLTLTDALISLESLRFMMGGAIKTPSATKSIYVRHTEEVVCGNNGALPIPEDHLTGLPYDGTKAAAISISETHPLKAINLTTGKRTQITSGTYTTGGNDGVAKAMQFVNALMDISTGLNTKKGDHVRLFWEEEVTNVSTLTSAVEVTISPSTFPGTYRVVGDTFMRSQETGADEPFQFIINKAKVLSNVTITLEAEGDPSTFEMTLNVLRSTNEDGQEEMMKLVRYTVGQAASASTQKDIGSLFNAASNSDD